MSVASFVQQFLPDAQRVSAQTGLPTDYILGQAGLESAWGASNVAQTRNNLFGISPGGTLASYANPSDSFTAYSNLMQTPRYAGAAGVAAGGGSALDIGNFINSQGYSETPDYGARVSGAVGMVDQALGGQGAGAVIASTAASLSGGGSAAGGATPTPDGASTGGASLFDPGSWIGALAPYASRAALIALAVILLLGAVYLFALRTQAVSSDATG